VEGKEVSENKCEAISRNLPGGTEKKLRETAVRIAGLRAEI
jgi:hypothetical protein